MPGIRSPLTMLGTGEASSVAMPVLDGLDVPAPLSACPSLRGQPCRPTPPIANVIAIGATAPPASPVPITPGFTG